MVKRSVIGIAVAVLFVIGAAYIVYQGRPVVELEREIEAMAEPQEVMAEEMEEEIEEEEMEEEMEEETEEETEDVETPVVTPAPAPAPAPVTGNPTDGFTMAEVRTHNSAASCWAAINGSVYDLTDWVNQHPGGRDRILSLCGTDGTAAFTTQHGGAKRPASMLVLFKIGPLQTP